MRYYTDTEREQVKRYLSDELELQTSGHGYVCPVCGENSISKLVDGGTRWICNRKNKCKSYGDIFDIYRFKYGLSAADAYRTVMQKYIDGDDVALRPKKPEQRQQPEELKYRVTSFREYIAKCEADMPDSRGMLYLLKRGFTPETIQRFHFGFDERCTVGGILKYSAPAVIVPYDRSGSYYYARFIKPLKINGCEHKGLKPRVETAGNEPIYNIAAIKAYRVVWLVEGQFDAVSVMQIATDAGLTDVGAIAFGGSGGANGARRLAQAIKENGADDVRIVISPDNDEAGTNWGNAAIGVLDDAGVKLTIDDVMDYGEHKDINGMLQNEPEKLKAHIIDMYNEIA